MLIPTCYTYVVSIAGTISGASVCFCSGVHGASGTVMKGTFLVNSFSVRILFDSEALHSFISHSFMRRLHLSPKFLEIPLSVETPLGDFSLLELVCGECVVSLDDVQFRIDLIVLLIFEFDIILGMD